VFGVITVLTLGLGIGASTAIFSVANAVLLRPLPYAAPDRLVAIWSNNTHQSEARNPVSPANFDAFRREGKSFTGMEAMYSFFTNAQLELGANREMLTGCDRDAGNVRPDRPLHRARPRPARRRRCRVSSSAAPFGHACSIPIRRLSAKPLRLTGFPGPLTVGWRRGADFLFRTKRCSARAVHTRIPSGRVAHVAAAIGPDGGRGGQPVRNVHFLAVIGRLKPGVPIDTARAELAAIATRRAADFPDSNDGWLVTALPLHAQVTGQIRPVVLLLFGGVALLLIMMCLNIANVLLARASGRQRDVAVRAALGASLGRLVQQSLVESALLGVLGGIAGVVVVFVATPLIISLAPADLPRLSETRFDLSVLAFALVLSIVTSFVLGALPALASSRWRTGALADTHRTTRRDRVSGFAPRSCRRTRAWRWS
jgi:hypothetical protein